MRRASGLTGHILEFAPERRGRFLYLSGTCGYTAGISRFDLRTGKLRVLARGEHGSLCGARLLVAGNRLLLAANHPPYPEPNVTSYIRIVDRRSGNLRRSVATPGSIVDIATGP